MNRFKTIHITLTNNCAELNLAGRTWCMQPYRKPRSVTRILGTDCKRREFADGNAARNSSLSFPLNAFISRPPSPLSFTRVYSPFSAFICSFRFINFANLLHHFIFPHSPPSLSSPYPYSLTFPRPFRSLPPPPLLTHPFHSLLISITPQSPLTPKPL